MSISQSGRGFLDTVDNGPVTRSFVVKSVETLQRGAVQLLLPWQVEEEMQLALIAGSMDRMPAKLSPHTIKLVKGYEALIDGETIQVPPSQAIHNLVVPQQAEVADGVGEIGEFDPSGQHHYIPFPGAMHKYNMMRLNIIPTCASHCRYCYVSDFLSRNNPDKRAANMEDAVNYVRDHNEAVIANGGTHPETGKPLLQEILLSGGDPMELPNKKLFEWMVALAEVDGVNTIRIGTKDLAFNPSRFDDNFFTALEGFRQQYPHIDIPMLVHFTHPDEFLQRDGEGNYVTDTHGEYVWMPEVEQAVERLSALGVRMMNQTPIIHTVNDDPEALRILQHELPRKGVENHYFFQCRPILGYPHFTVPIEQSLALFSASREGLNGTKLHGKLVMSTEQGKTEIVGVFPPKPDVAPDAPDSNGTIIFRVIRSAEDETFESLVMAGRTPEAAWITDYTRGGLIISDPAGAFPTQAAQLEMDRLEALRVEALKAGQDNIPAPGSDDTTHVRGGRGGR